MIRRFVDMIFGRPSPPHDERSIKGEQIAELADETKDALDRVDRLVPAQYRRAATERIRRDVALAEQRLQRR